MPVACKAGDIMHSFLLFCIFSISFWSHTHTQIVIIFIDVTEAMSDIIRTQRRVTLKNIHMNAPIYPDKVTCTLLAKRRILSGYINRARLLYSCCKD